MDQRTLTALQASIKHWEETVATKNPDDVKLGARACALCYEFYGDGCSGCPISEVTGEDFCADTPYGFAHTAWSRWARAARKHSLSTATFHQLFLEYAQAELAFLKSLLPGAASFDLTRYKDEDED